MALVSFPPQGSRSVHGMMVGCYNQDGGVSNGMLLIPSFTTLKYELLIR